MHFWEEAARTYGRCSRPRNTSLNWFMPALVNSSVGSWAGMRDEDVTTWCPRFWKNSRNRPRMSDAVGFMIRPERRMAAALGPSDGAGDGDEVYMTVRARSFARAAAPGAYFFFPPPPAACDFDSSKTLPPGCAPCAAPPVSKPVRSVLSISRWDLSAVDSMPAS